MKKIIALTFASLLFTSSSAHKIKATSTTKTATSETNKLKLDNRYKVPCNTTLNPNRQINENV
jgi:hypothetical protein